MYESVIIVGTNASFDKNKTVVFDTYFPTFPRVGMHFADDDGEVYKINRVIIHTFRNADEAKYTAQATLEVEKLNENIG